jgi:hypothetical protein
MSEVGPLVTASGLLFGFLFAGFWWALNRELTFEPAKRHFKYAYALLLVTMALVAFFGITRPLYMVGSKVVVTALPGLAAAFVGVFGYMLTEFGHYGIFQRPKYVTRSERMTFWATVVAIAAIGLWGAIRRVP